MLNSKTLLAGVLCLLCLTTISSSQEVRYGAEVSGDVEMIYQKGLEWLATNQSPDGDWTGPVNSREGAGVAGMCIMAFMASGEDPNFGKYADNIRRAVRVIINKQDPQTGYLHGGSMYQHGFGMLALSEVYGAVDDELLWIGATNTDNRKLIGECLELAVRCAVTSQENNPWHAWRYSPRTSDADTSVSGAVLMGLLAARNAGIEVPDECIEEAIDYFQKLTTSRGDVGYTGAGGSSPNLQAIALLVYSISQRKDVPGYQAVLPQVINNSEQSRNAYQEYYRYYMTQALFQGDYENWQKWNTRTIKELKDSQRPDGSFGAGEGPTYGTAMALLALGLNYRFLPIYER